MGVNLSKIIAEPFWGIHSSIKNHEYTQYWLKGGRGSTKSSFVSEEIPLIMLRNPDVHCVVLRKVGNTIKTSVFPQMQWGLEKLNLTNKFKYLTSPHEMIYQETGQRIIFLGVDDPMKVKSIKVPFGYIGIVWLEEADQFQGMEEVRSLNQSLLRGGDKFWEFVTYNPPKTADCWINGETLQTVPGRLVHHSTYLDVPRRWLGDTFFAEAEILKAKNPRAYAHEYLGEVTGTGGTVFENVSEMTMSDEMVSTFDKLYAGCDFGFAVDPLAFTYSYYNHDRRELYIFDEIYQQKLGNREAVTKIMDKTHNHTVVTCDSAEPRTIREFHDLGLKVCAARKGPDSVEHGIKWLQNLNAIYVDKERCPNTYRELIMYEYDRNKDGQFISSYPDKNNHAIDSLRYATELLMREPIDVTSRRQTLW